LDRPSVCISASGINAWRWVRVIVAGGSAAITWREY
jgi:hypothetical protein